MTFTIGQRVTVAPLSLIHLGGTGTVISRGTWNDRGAPGWYVVRIDGDLDHYGNTATRTIGAHEMTAV